MIVFRCDSLTCVKHHKIEFGCSGVRCKTTFVPIKEFSDNVLYSGKWLSLLFTRQRFQYTIIVSDYHFLEDVGRCVESAHRFLFHQKRELEDNRARVHRVSKKIFLLFIIILVCLLGQFHWLKHQASQRGTRLHLLPEGMSRHRSNTSRTVRTSENGQKTSAKKWEIHWCLQLQFPQADMEFHNTKYSRQQILYIL